MADKLRPRLDRLQELAKQVNAATDDAGRVVQGVETYLSDQLHIGVTGSVVLESDEDPPAGHYFRRELFYGRHGERFRIYVRHFMEFEGSVETDEETLWANCPRDVKLMSFNRLPDLLDQLVNCLEATLEQVRLNSETIQALLPQPKAKGAKS